MRNFFIKSLSFLKWIFILFILLSLIVFLILQGSVPHIDGHKTITILEHSIQIERDRQGIPTIRAKSRADTAYALGYVHAQERFFQMDLLRRSAAGELSALLGSRALEKDALAKLHRFRERAQKIIRRLPSAHFILLQAYANGVNSGIESITEPYQYLLLGQSPKIWETEDSLLTLYAIYFDLNDELGKRETSLAIMRDQLPPEWFEFLTPKGGQWDAPLDGLKLAASETLLSIPDTQLPEQFKWQKQIESQQQFKTKHLKQREQYQEQPLSGSNSWVIGGALSANSSAMLANDMHLNLRVPNIWYRASWYLQDGRRVTGITLPGFPAMVAGSNERVAWGFSNSYGDWGDIIVLQANETETQYLTEKGWKNFSIHHHTIESRGRFQRGSSKEILTIETIWGPVIGKNHKGEMIVHQWLAHSPDAVNLNFLQLESAFSVNNALTIAPTLGVPSMNMVLADTDGHIAWTIAGLIPDRKNVSAVPRHEGWSGFKKAHQYPVLRDPANHRIWTGNNRLFSGDKLAMIGFEGGALGARAQQVRDALQAKDNFQEADFLAIQNDVRALFLQRWKQLLSDSIVEPKQDDIGLMLIREALDKEGTFAAESASMTYGLVKKFRNIVIRQTMGQVYEVLEKNNPHLFDRSTVDKMIEYPVWELVSKKPQHLIPGDYNSWNDYFIAAARQSYNEITHNGQKMFEHQSWGTQHKIDIRHPLSSALPGLGLILDMPQSPISGDEYMPKVMRSDFGAAMRMVVSPGEEEKGILVMPGGQSSHPFSPYYSRGHEDWVAGKAGAFLPGNTKWTLELRAFQ